MKCYETMQPVIESLWHYKVYNFLEHISEHNKDLRSSNPYIIQFDTKHTFHWYLLSENPCVTWDFIKLHINENWNYNNRYNM
jgi:hypothetical protein